ncbi:MAG: hypothetical protein IOD15_03480 [Phycisphaerales bacterium]|nr:hypothetical protein [Phycisphaerales bacterium]
MAVGDWLAIVSIAVLLFGLVPVLALAVWTFAFKGLVARPTLGAAISAVMAIGAASLVPQNRSPVNAIYEIIGAGVAWTAAFAVTEGVARLRGRASAGWAGVVASVVVSVVGFWGLYVFVPPLPA